jgi:signal transduction histidine kinase/CheY-like chemotaxis protein
MVYPLGIAMTPTSSPQRRLFGLPLPFPGSKRIWRGGVLLFVSYLAATRLSTALFTAPAVIFPAAGIALAGLALEGLVLWPFVFLASLAGYLLNGSSLTTLAIMPIAHTLQAAIGAVLLRRASIDPLFRKTRDMLVFLAITALVSLIVPLFGSLARYLNSEIYGVEPSSVTFGSWYIAMAFSILMFAPFVIRWFAKPRFTRTGLHIFEILASFSFLTLIGYFLFFSIEPEVAGISLIYFLLVPLFWIALRLRPRFLTLAFLILATLGISGAFFGPFGLSGEALGVRLYQTELFLVILAVIFYILVAVEEERRVTTSLMQSQVGTLENALSQLKDQDRAKTEFIAMLAHELRNPLAPIMSAVEFLKLKGSPDPEKLATFEMMEDRMKTVKRLLDDLLDVSRLSEKKLSVTKELLDLRGPARRAAQSVEAYYRERHQSLSLTLPDTPVYIEGDPVRLEQIVANLLVNASKYSNSRDKVTLTIEEHEAVVELRVVDRGIGIDPSAQKHIFEPFRQAADDERSKRGVGIGLALVKTLVELHGGGVRVKSEGRGRGSEFTVMLPRASEERVAVYRAKEKEVAAPDVVSPRILPSRATVLIVDDNDAAAAGIGRLLELSGHAVEYAYDGGQAIEKAARHPYAVILLDIGLPDMDGFSAARAIRAGGFSGSLVALTGYSLDEAKQKAVEAGIDHYLIKPVGLADLKTVLPAA